MKKLSRIFIFISVIFIFYICISWVLLDGDLIYHTSFNAATIQDSKTRGFFVSSELNVVGDGYTLQDWYKYFEIWTNKRYEMKYFGILFYWTFNEPDWRYLNIRIKDTAEAEIIDYCIKNQYNGDLEGCCNYIKCSVNDTILMEFYKCKGDVPIGSLKILIK